MLLWYPILPTSDQKNREKVLYDLKFFFRIYTVILIGDQIDLSYIAEVMVM